ncbi:MAG: hypothetical protein AB1798_17495 [Spirochaetota bacterium]
MFITDGKKIAIGLAFKRIGRVGEETYKGEEIDGAGQNLIAVSDTHLRVICLYRFVLSFPMPPVTASSCTPIFFATADHFTFPNPPGLPGVPSRSVPGRLSLLAGKAAVLCLAASLALIAELTACRPASIYRACKAKPSLMGFKHARLNTDPLEAIGPQSGLLNKRKPSRAFARAEPKGPYD